MKINIFREYYILTKPGIIYGNALTAAAGFFVAAQGHVDFVLFIEMLLGVSLIIGSACVFNNYIDRDIDAQMERTKSRALVRGTISLHNAINFGILLGLIGSVLLYLVNILTLVVALIGIMFVYVVVYSMWCKRNTLHATTVGAISGAIPPVVGYVAVTNSIDLGALILFLILFTWQMPHALAIAIRRFDDYKKAGIPVMPVALGMVPAKAQMLCYAFAFCLASIALGLVGFAGKIYLVGMTLCSLIWFTLCLQGFWTQDEKKWASRVFFFSLIIILVFCFLCAINSLVF
jgi:protoheme IX farnesyltransferase